MEKEFREKISIVFENLLVPLSMTIKSGSTLSSSNEPAVSLGQKSVTLNEDHLRNLFFGDYMKSKDEIRFYDEISDLELLKKVTN
jgi:hypothetical protein